MGEVNASLTLVKAIQNKYPEIPLIITTMTVTGSQRVRTLYGDSVFHVYLPYDTPYFIKNFLRRIQPELLIVIETELWPNLLHSVRNFGVRLMLANARISERSSIRYQKFSLLPKQC